MRKFKLETKKLAELIKPNGIGTHDANPFLIHVG